MHCHSTVSNTITHEAVSVDSLPTVHVYMYCRCTVKGLVRRELPRQNFRESVSDYIHLSTRYVRVGVLRDVTRFLKSDWFALYAAKVFP